ncbi:4Fe-4S dicluster domain-containing protein [Adlercreutzia muris]|uniref:4Fe-4S dicluster domain-containing protein n=1 Tax=Adlercreutzia muris TaxID=1796610 RepID=UPI00351290AF
MPRGFYFDNTRCTGCRTCALACKDFHDHGPDQAFRRVIDYEGGSWKVDADGTVSTDAYGYHISLSCNHCTSAACTKVCPTGAMHRDDMGLVWPDMSRCIGCGYCTMACPYHAPAIDQELKRSSKCDGCHGRVAAGRSPICIEACPLRALDFGTTGELAERHPDDFDRCTRSVMPLPPKEATTPNLFVLASPAARRAEAGDGRIANREELGL